MKARLILLNSILFVFSVTAQNADNYSYDPTRLDSKWILDGKFQPQLQKLDSLPRFAISDLQIVTDYKLINRFESQKSVDFTLPKLPKYYDYSSNIYDVVPLNSNSWISTKRVNTNFVGMGGLSYAGAQYNLKLNSSMVYSVGATVSKYNIYNSFYNDISINSAMKVKVTDRLSLNLFGTYSPLKINDNNMVRMMNSSMLPQTGYGGAFEFKVTDKWGLVSGAKREYDVIRRKWVTQPFIMPVFYSK